MTIGIDCRLYSTTHTGIGRYIVELLRHIPELDQKNQYILYFNKPEFDQYQSPEERFQKKLVNIPHYSLDEQSRWPYFLKKEPLDLLHVPHFNAPIWYKKPLLVTIHDLTLHCFPDKRYEPRLSVKKLLQIAAYRFLFAQAVGSASHIITVSNHTKHDLLSHYSLSEKKISTMYEGVPEEFQRPSKEKIDEVKRKFAINVPYFSYAGSFRSHKNLLHLFQAFKEIENCQLVIIGKKSQEYPEIFSEIDRLGIKDRVIMTDYVSDADLMALVSGSTAFVFPSLYEGFGLPPLEAMQLQVPVIASQAASIPEVCGDGALYFDPRSPLDIAKAMKQVLSNENLRHDLIQKGLENVKKYSFKTMTQQTIDIYNKICNNVNPAGRCEKRDPNETRTNSVSPK